MTVWASDICGGQTHGVHGLSLRVELGRDETEHGILAKFTISPQVFVRCHTKDIGTIKPQPTYWACEFTSIRINDDLFLVNGFLFFLFFFELEKIK